MRANHGAAVNNLVRYLESTKNGGIILGPRENKSLGVFEDDDLCRNWQKPTAPKDFSTAKSCTGYAIMYVVCLDIWSFKLQTEILLSTIGDEYMSLWQ